jgi:hypothetical protein
VDGATKRRVDRLDLVAGEPVELYGTDDLSPDSFVGYREPGGCVRLGVDLPDFSDIVKVGGSGSWV